MELLEYFSSLHGKGVVPVLGYPGLAAEKVSAEECLRDPSLHARVVRTNLELYATDAALPLPDLSVGLRPNCEIKMILGAKEMS